MNPKTVDLLQAVGAAPEKNPVMLSLLELGAQLPRMKGDFPTYRKRLERQWKRIVAAFRICHAEHVTDKQLRAALPFEGLEFTDEAGWKLTGDPIAFREWVARAFEALAGGKGRELVAFEIKTVEDLRRAQRRNGLAPFDSPLVLPKATLEGRLLEGRHVVISRVLDGEKVHTALQFDQFGRGKVVAHEILRRVAYRACKPIEGKKKK